MNTREIAAEYRLSHWAGVMQERSASGMNVKEFCKSSGIHENVYYYWQRKLREATCAELAVRERESETSLVPGGWTQLEATASVQSNAAVSIEINGCRVEVTGETDPKLLAMVCRTLKIL